MRTWIARISGVPLSEQRKTSLVLAYIFFATSACVVGRATADTLFLARIGADLLAEMVLGSAIVVAVGAMAYAWLASHVSLRVLIATTHLTLAVASVLFRWLLPTHHHDVWVIAPIYVLSEVQGAISSILFATLLNEVFHRPRSRGVFGVAGIGSTLAGIVFGTVVAIEAAQIHVANLLFVIAALHGLGVFASAGLRSRSMDANPTAAPSDSDSAELAEGPARIGAYERWLAALALVQFPAILVVGYQWKVAVDQAYHATEDGMAAYFGAYYAIMNAVTFLLQAAIAGRALRRVDPLPSLWTFPVALLGAATAILTTSGERVLLFATTLSKGSESLRRSFTDPAIQLLFRPLPNALRRRVIAAIGGGVKPFSEAIAALVIVEVTHLTGTRELSWLAGGLAIAWIAISWRCRQLYTRSLSGEIGNSAT